MQNKFWWMLIWLCFAGGILNMVVPKKKIRIFGKTEERWCWPAVIFLSFPYVIWCGCRGVYGDTETYRQIFLQIPDSFLQLPKYLVSHPKDPGFTVLMVLIKTTAGNRVTIFFLILASFQMLSVVSFFRKYSEDFLFSIFLFVASTDYISWMFNGIRQFTAVCIILLATDYFLRKKYFRFFCLVVLAVTVHGSAALILPLIPVVKGKAWNKRTLLLIAGVGAAILFMGQFTSVLNRVLSETQYSGLVKNEIWQTDDGTNPIRVLIYSIPAFLSLVGKRYVEEENSPEVHFFVNCGICTAVLYLLSAFSSGIYVGRIPIYTTLPGYAVMPWLIHHSFTPESARLITSLIILVYLVFFYIQIHLVWNY